VHSLSIHIVLVLSVGCASLTARAATPYDLLPLNPVSPNYAMVFSGVRINNSVAEIDDSKAGEEMLSATYAYLCPDSPVYNNPVYRNRLFVLLDDRLGACATGLDLQNIGFIWQAAYSYLLMKHHRPGEISPERKTIYEQGLANTNAATITRNPLLYSPPSGSGVLAQVWLNGDIRLAKGAYFGGLALGDATTAEKARAAIDGVLTRCGLAGGGTRYVGFWNEVAAYHNETVKSYIYWWKITGSLPVKAALDATLRYSVVANEPSGFVEQSSNIPYKHMYNNIRSERASLWKAYLYNDGYNYYFGASKETSTSTELLNTILYQPSRRLLFPPTEVGVFFDRNIQGPRYRSSTWGWVVNGRDVQNGGPEELAYSQSQDYDGRMGGKGTLVGAFTLGPIANNTSLKGALDTVCVEFKESTGTESDYNRGTKYRFLTQDEKTRVITRRNFGTVSSSYRISKRTSSNATTNWNGGATAWLGQQLWVLTGERMIGLVQLVNDANSTVYGLDARLVFTGGRKNIMGSYLDLLQPDASSFSFGDLRSKIHATTFTGAITSQRIPISDISSTDDFSALVRINDPLSANDAAITCTAASPRRNWLVLDVTRAGTPYATSVINVLKANSTWAVLQFTEGKRKVRIVQNLTNSQRTYTGSFIVGSTYSRTSLHRSWNDTVSPIAVTGSTATVADTVPAYGHMIAVNSNEVEDHTFVSPLQSWRLENFLQADNTGTAADLADPDADGVNNFLEYALGTDPQSSGTFDMPISALIANSLQLTFPRARSDLTYIVEASSDLTTWATLATNPGTVGQSVTVTDTFSLSPAHPPRRFLRLRITNP
jgi:hypothetical protein